MPLKVVPAISAVISRDITVLFRRNSGSCLFTILYAIDSPIAVFPTPSPPTRITLFFFLLPSVLTIFCTSSSLPTSSSISPLSTSSLRFEQYDGMNLSLPFLAFFFGILMPIFSRVSSPTMFLRNSIPSFPLKLPASFSSPFSPKTFTLTLSIVVSSLFSTLSDSSSYSRLAS